MFCSGIQEGSVCEEVDVSVNDVYLPDSHIDIWLGLSHEMSFIKLSSTGVKLLSRGNGHFLPPEILVNLYDSLPVYARQIIIRTTANFIQMQLRVHNGSEQVLNVNLSAPNTANIENEFVYNITGTVGNIYATLLYINIKLSTTRESDEVISTKLGIIGCTNVLTGCTIGEESDLILTEQIRNDLLFAFGNPNEGPLAVRPCGDPIVFPVVFPVAQQHEFLDHQFLYITIIISNNPMTSTLPVARVVVLGDVDIVKIVVKPNINDAEFISAGVLTSSATNKTLQFNPNMELYAVQIQDANAPFFNITDVEVLVCLLTGMC